MSSTNKNPCFRDLVERIRRNRCGEALGTTKKLLLAMRTAAVILPVVFSVPATPRLLAQSLPAPDWQTAAGGKMEFDVASVKPTQSAGRPTSNVPLLGDVYAPTGGLFSATNMPLMNYLRFAFKDVKLAYGSGSDLAGAPNWVRTQPYDIEARAQGNPAKDQMRLMMQSLLADRFKLAVHYEKRPLPAYALALSKEGKTGPQLKPDDGPCSTSASDVQTINTAPQLPPPAVRAASASEIPCGVLIPVPASAPGLIRIAGRKVTLALLAQMAPNGASGIDHPVVDQTGLVGTYDVSFEFEPRPNGPPPPGFTPAPDDAGPTFIQALQNQLGLKLVPQTAPLDVLVIDHVEQPSEN